MGKVVTFAPFGQMLSTAQYQAIKNAGWWKRANGTVDAWPNRGGDGSAHRFGAVATVTNDSSRFVIVDSKEDWRDRVMVVDWAIGVPTTPSAFTDGFDLGFGSFAGVNDSAAWPGLNERLSFTNDAGSQLMITGSGAVAPQATRPDFGIELAPGLFLYADAVVRGQLILNGSAALSSPKVGVVLIIHSHDPLGIEQAAAPLFDPTPTGEEIAPGELNVLQDAALWEQFDGLDPLINPSDGTQLSGFADSMPFGLKVSGSNPGIPLAFEPRRRDGIAYSDVRSRYRFRRQRMAGGERRRVSGASVTDASFVVLDDTVDWRDRLLHVAGRHHDGQLRPGNAGDTSYNVRTPFASTFYSWVGKASGSVPADNRHQATLVGGLAVYVEQDTGRLIARNDTGSTRYLCLLVEGTPKLGPRTEARE